MYALKQKILIVIVVLFAVTLTFVPVSFAQQTYSECIALGLGEYACESMFPAETTGSTTPANNPIVQPSSSPSNTGQPATNPPPPAGAPLPSDCGPNYSRGAGGLCFPNVGPNTGIAGTQTLQGLILEIIRILLLFAGLVAVLIIVYGGYLYITAAGNEERSEKGKKALLHAVVGLVIVVLAYMIVTLVVNTLTKEIVV